LDPKRLVKALFDDPALELVVELWDGTRIVSPRQHVKGSLILRNPEVASLLVPPIDEDDVTDAFARGDIDIEGDAVAVLEAVARWRGPRVGLGNLIVLASSWRERVRRAQLQTALDAKLSGSRRSQARDVAAVQHHYDISNDFYRLFLDSRLVYSCAVFPKGDETLDDGQRLKLDLICRKLNLRKNDRFLDVGCGWGALLEHAAHEYGAACTGATVSRAQFLEARRHAAEGRVDIQVLECDYRRLPHRTFDKIASVGMMEHVGAENLPRYFEELGRRLRPGGLLLNHAIADISPESRTVPWLRRQRGGFIQRCIFPDSELPPLRTVIAHAEGQGFEVRDVESLREHYDQTLRHWLRNLEARFEAAKAIVGTARARTWRLYLAISAVAFRLGRIGVYQTLLAKRDEAGRVQGIPRWRASWHASRRSLTLAPPSAEGNAS
jgi:cyclopropane-fatty-acyl-phospholipid synthase